MAPQKKYTKSALLVLTLYIQYYKLDLKNRVKVVLSLVHYLKLKKIEFIENWHADWKHNVEQYEAEAVF